MLIWLYSEVYDFASISRTYPRNSLWVNRVNLRWVLDIFISTWTPKIRGNSKDKHRELHRGITLSRGTFLCILIHVNSAWTLEGPVSAYVLVISVGFYRALSVLKWLLKANDAFYVFYLYNFLRLCCVLDLEWKQDWYDYHSIRRYDLIFHVLDGSSHCGLTIDSISRMKNNTSCVL